MPHTRAGPGGWDTGLPAGHLGLSSELPGRAQPAADVEHTLLTAVTSL